MAGFVSLTYAPRGQKRQGRACGQRVRSRWEHVRQEGQAKTRGELHLPLPRKRLTISFVGQMYRHAHAKDMPLRAIARLIQTMLYAQRFFPYYVYNILGGIEEDGKHCSPPSQVAAYLYPYQAQAQSTRSIL